MGTEKEREKEMEFTFSEAEYNALLAEQRAERMKGLRRHRLPEKLTLREALSGMTKPELEDIQYNLNLPLAKNIGRVKKADMLETLEPEVVSFAGRWFVSALQEQKELFDFACQHGGLLENLQCEDYRLDYLRGIGVLFCGMREGKLVWYMPEEIQAEYRKISNGAFNDAVNLNSEVMRLAAGMVFFYGIINYDELYKRVCGYIDGELDFADFMGIIFNGGCWYSHVVTRQHDLMHEALMNPEALQEAQRRQSGLDYAELPYDRLYDAGQEGYIDSTAAYRALAQYFMQKKGLDVLQAAEAVHSIAIIIQNGYGMREIVGFLTERSLKMDNQGDTEELYRLIGAYNDSMPMWALKGHTPGAAAGRLRPAAMDKSHKGNMGNKEKAGNKGGRVSKAGKEDKVGKDGRVGRNDPCPCGSGKKYKNCCLNKDVR